MRKRSLSPIIVFLIVFFVCTFVGCVKLNDEFHSKVIDSSQEEIISSSNNLEHELSSPQQSKYTVTLSCVGEGAVSGGGSYQEGDAVNIIASANAEYYFYGWYIDEDTTIAENPYTFVMPNKNVHYVAMFLEKKYTLTVSTTQGGWISGSLSVAAANIPMSTKIKKDQLVTLTAWEKSGYSFKGWYSGNQLITTTKILSFNMLSQNVALSAVFSANSGDNSSQTTQTYTLTLGLYSNGGTAWASQTGYSSSIEVFAIGTTKSKSFYENTSITLGATANFGYAFIGWYINGELKTTQANYTFKITKNCTVSAAFIKIS